jgi:hypothetical protein
MPHLDMIGSGNFSFPENDSNVSPFSKSSAAFGHSVQTMSLSAISAVCQIDREKTASLLKAIFIKFIEQGRQSRHCKLDLKIGHLVCYPNGSLQFENVKS